MPLDACDEAQEKERRRSQLAICEQISINIEVLTFSK